MNFLVKIFNLILYRPLLNFLFLFYQYLPGNDFGVAIIFLTILIKILFYPLGTKAIKTQKILEDLQPKIEEVQRKYKDDREKQTLEIVKLYQGAKINPFSSLLPLLIQLPILIALYQVFRKGFSLGEMINLYHFVPRPEMIKTTFLGIIDLSKPFILKINDQVVYYWPVFILAVLAGITQFYQVRMMTSKIKKAEQKGGQMAKISEIIQKQTLYFFPIFTVFILLNLPAALGLYWVVTSLFSIIQQFFILKKYA